MGELEAIGDAITGGVIGRAVEPRAGEGEGKTHETACLNCGTPLTGPYCHQCGQHAHVHRTLSAFFHDFAHGVLHFEGKIWRTLPMLAWRPGELTRRYINGERARFVSPIALFLFCVFLMFGVLSATGNVNPKWGKQTSDLAVQQRQTEQELAGLRDARTKLVEKKLPTGNVDRRITDAQADLTVIKDMRQKGVTSAILNTRSTIDTDVPLLKRAFAKAKENPELLIYKLKSNSYKWSWAIIPLSVPFLWLLFPFSRRFRVYDHTIFITYSVAFMMLLVTAAVLLSAAGLGAVGGMLFLVPPVHMYRQLRGAYGVSMFGAIWRTLLLTIFALLVLIAFILLMGTLGILD